MSNPLVTINLVVFNGEKYIRHCLDSIKKQTYQFLEVNVLDNASTDGTKEVIRNWKLINFIENEVNLGMWPGQEKLLEQSRGEYIVVVSVDIILDPHFVEEAVKVFEKDQKIGAVQSKIYKYELADLKTNTQNLKPGVIDTCGFEIFRSREITNIGHGEEDGERYDEEREIFAVEGAVPVFQKKALEDCRLVFQGNKIIDPDYFWYGDDLDLAWRMRLFGWKQVYSPRVIAWHDRKTTKSLSGSMLEFVKIRKTIPLFKRKLDFKNTTLTIIKNDFLGNVFKDFFQILWRQIRLLGYYLIFEPAVFFQIFVIAKWLPRMLKRRREIMKKARVSAKEMRQWIS